MLIATSDLISGEKEIICWHLCDFGFPEKMISDFLGTIKTLDCFS